jgi:hypothetical protein
MSSRDLKSHVFSGRREEVSHVELPFILYAYSRMAPPVRSGPPLAPGVQVTPRP